MKRQTQPGTKKPGNRDYKVVVKSFKTVKIRVFGPGNKASSVVLYKAKTAGERIAASVVPSLAEEMRQRVLQEFEHTQEYDAVRISPNEYNIVWRRSLVQVGAIGDVQTVQIGGGNA